MVGQRSNFTDRDFYIANPNSAARQLLLDVKMDDKASVRQDKRFGFDKTAYIYSVEIEFRDPLLDLYTSYVNSLRNISSDINRFLNSATVPSGIRGTEAYSEDGRLSYGLGTRTAFRGEGWNVPFGSVNPVTYDYTEDFSQSNLAAEFNDAVRAHAMTYAGLIKILSTGAANRDQNELNYERTIADLENMLSVTPRNSPRTLMAFRDEVKQVTDYLSQKVSVSYDTTQPRISMPFMYEGVGYSTFLRRNSHMDSTIKVEKTFNTTPIAFGLSNIECYNQSFITEYRSPMLSERRVATKIENDIRKPYYNMIPIPMSDALTRQGADGEGSISYSEFSKMKNINFKWFDPVEFTSLFGPQGTVQRLFTNDEIQVMSNHQAANVGVRRAARPVWMED